jgi:hypothetical protein
MRGNLVEQQAGAGAQDVPVRSLMKIVSEGVGELVESHKAKNAVGMLKELISTSEPSPFSGLKELKEIGLDFGTITGVHKEAAEVFKSVAHEEREARKEAQAVAEKYKQDAEQVKTELMRLQMESYVKAIENQIAELKKALSSNGERKSEPDPITKSLQEVAAELVKSNLSQVLAPQVRKSPEEELLERLTLTDKLREYFRARHDGDDVRRQALVGDIKTEVLKLILEDEREREHLAEQRQLERERIEMIKSGAQALKDNLGDLLRAIMETASVFKAQRQAEPQHQAGPQGAGQLQGAGQPQAQPSQPTGEVTNNGGRKHQSLEL